MVGAVVSEGAWGTGCGAGPGCGAGAALSTGTGAFTGATGTTGAEAKLGHTPPVGSVPTPDTSSITTRSAGNQMVAVSVDGLRTPTQAPSSLRAVANTR